MSNPVTQAFYFGIVFVALVWLWLWLTESPGEPYPSRWEAFKERQRTRYVKRVEWRTVEEADAEDAENEDETPETGNDETPETSIAEPKMTGKEKFPFPDSFAVLAALVQAGKVKEIEALQIAFGVTPGGSARYKVARGKLTEALAKTGQAEYPPRTPEQLAARQALGLDSD